MWDIIEEEEGSVGKANGLKCYKVNKESRGQWERWGTAVRECQGCRSVTSPLGHWVGFSFNSSFKYSQLISLKPVKVKCNTSVNRIPPWDCSVSSL